MKNEEKLRYNRNAFRQASIILMLVVLVSLVMPVEPLVIILPCFGILVLIIASMVCDHNLKDRKNKIIDIYIFTMWFIVLILNLFRF